VTAQPGQQLVVRGLSAFSWLARRSGLIGAIALLAVRAASAGS
jgi:hypothetical protein